MASKATLKKLSCIEQKLCDLIALTVDDKDVVAVCNTETNLIEYHVIGYVGGVPQPPVIAVSTLSCDQNKDYEFKKVCDVDTNTLHAITFYLDDDEQEVIVSNVDTGEACKCEGTPETWKKKELYAGVENTKTRFNRSYKVNVTLANGEIRTTTIPAGSGWLDQMDNQWTPAFLDLIPEACEVANHWWEWREANLPNQGTGSVPPSDMNFPAAFGQFIQFTFCPADAGFMPINVEVIETNGVSNKPWNLITATDETEVEYLTHCVSCDPDCQVDPPKCAIPSSDNFPGLPQPTCTFDTVTACDDGTDPQEQIVVVYSLCDSGITKETFQDDGNGNLEEYTLVGNAVDCASGEVIPEPECEKQIIAVEPKYDVVESSGVAWTLFSKFEPTHPDAASYPDSFTHIGDLLTSQTGNSTHPVTGDSIDGWSVYGACFDEGVTPATDSNGHDWVLGLPSTFSGNLTYDGAVSADPNCSGASLCTEIQQIKEKDTCTGLETYRFVKEDGEGNLIPYQLIGDLKNNCPVVDEDCTKTCTLGEGQCREVGKIDSTPTQSGWASFNSGTATHGVKHATASQTITDQINTWVNAGYIVVMESDQFGIAVVDTMNFYSPTNTTFTARADHTQSDPCELFSQAVDGSANAPHNMTYTAYEVGEEGTTECITKVRSICSSEDDPVFVSVVPNPPTQTCEIDYFLGCDDINGDGSVIVTYLRPIQTCYLEGVQTSQTVLPFLDENLDEYTPVNEIVCDPATLDFDEEIYCDSVNSFIRRTIVVAGVGAIVEEVELDGTTPYTTQGVITQGACPAFKIEPTVLPCGRICRAAYGSGRGGVNQPNTTDFELFGSGGSIATGANFNEFVDNINAAGYSAQADVVIYNDQGLQIADTRHLVITSDKDVSSITYTNFNGDPVTLFFTCDTIWAQAVKNTCDSKLDAILDALTDDCIGLDVGSSTLIDGQTGESTGTIVQFPFQSQAGQLGDFVTPFSLPSVDCLTSLDPTTKIRVRVSWLGHDLVSGSNGTSGAQVIIGALDSSGDAEIVGWSSTNTTTQNTLGDPNGFMGTIAGGLDNADRWIDWDIPLQDLLDGTTITTSAFGGSNSGITESLDRQEIKLLTDLTQLGCENQCEECC